MKFSEAIKDADQPALAIWQKAFELVFDKDDGNTEHLERLSPQARLVYQIWNFDGEIHNGGFDQLFVNSLGDHCTEILQGLQTIGAVKSRALLEQAMACFPDGKVPADRGERWDVWAPISEREDVREKLNSLDGQFYDYEDNITGLLDAFAAANGDASVSA